MDHVEETESVFCLDPAVKKYFYRLDCVDSLFTSDEELFTISVEFDSDSVPEGKCRDIRHF